MLVSAQKITTFMSMVEGKISELQTQLANPVDSDAIINEMSDEVAELNKFIGTMEDCNKAMLDMIIAMNAKHPDIMSAAVDAVNLAIAEAETTETTDDSTDDSSDDTSDDTTE